MLTEQDILEALKQVKYPGYSRDIVSFGLVKQTAYGNGAAAVQIQLTSGAPEIAAQIKAECERVLRGMPEVRMVHVVVRVAAQQGGGIGQTRGVPGVGKIIAVASGKGGVGKSTVSVNLACALQQMGARVGLLDCDIYGPSVPLMMGCRERPMVNESEQLVPPVSHGVRLMSIGFLLEGDQPVIWRGPMIVKTIQQFLMQVDWDALDYLLVDLPPGTGDAQLTLCQTVPLSGGVVVTTPQEASLGVVRKGIAMFEKVHVPILGIVENMSYFTAPNGDRVEIFGHGGGQSEATRQGIPFLGEIPIFTEIRIGGDEGVPIVVKSPESAPAKAFNTVAAALRERVG